MHPLLLTPMPVSSLRLELVFTVNDNAKKKFDSGVFSWEGNDVKAFITLARFSCPAIVAVFRVLGCSE